MDKTKNKEVSLLLIITSFILVLSVGVFTSKLTAAAEINLAVKEINYLNSTITLQVGSGDTSVYFSDSTKKKWEMVPGQVSSNGTISMDISWISPSKNYTMSFQGNNLGNIISVTIPKQVTNLSASFNKLKGTIAFSNTENRIIEWRKKGSTTWNTLNESTHSSELSYYFTNGAQLYYRLAPVNGTGMSNPGLRASNEVAVSIPKKTAAPAVTINGSKFIIPVKKGMSYRKVNTDGTMTDWVNVNSSIDLKLSEIASEALYLGSTVSQREVTLQFRTNSSSTSQVSNITSVTVPIQKGAPSEDSNGIALNYTSSSTLTLTVRAASTTTPYEYTIIPMDKELNYQTAIWKSITSSTAVTINSTSAPIGSKIYVRMKSVEASSTVKFSLASMEVNLTGNTGVTYPVASQVTQLTTLISTAGVCQSSTSSTYLTFYLYSPTSTTVTSVDFYDVYGIKKGTVTTKSTVALNSKRTGDSDRYIITTNITSTDEINAYTKETLYAHITLVNQEVIKSSASAGVLLYLYPATIVNNPNDANYSIDFKRIYMSVESKDASSFSFQLNFGTEKVIDPSEINKFTAEATMINSLKYNGYTLVKGTDYTVEYGSYVAEDKTISTATVTVNVSVMEKSADIKSLGQALPLTINLNNNEILNNKVMLTMISTATIDNTPIAWSITEGSLQEKTTSTVTNSDGSTTTKTQEVITYTITLSLFSENYGVSISNVTWGDVSIFGSATISKGKATIYLSNAKINKLMTNSTDTKNIVITLSNGYVIDTGCKLTILNAN